MSLNQKFFSAEGRIRRSEYWSSMITLGVFQFIAQFAVFAVLSPAPFDRFLALRSAWIMLEPTTYNIAMFFLQLAFIFPQICIAAKRWHDRNRPGWLAGALLFVGYAIVFVQMLTGAFHGDQFGNRNWPLLLGTMIPGLALAGWQIIELGFLDGTKGSNKYGRSPKDAGEEQAAEF